jgi:hypothetical protein
MSCLLLRVIITTYAGSCQKNRISILERNQLRIKKRLLLCVF